MLAPRPASASASAFTTRATPWVSAWRNTGKGRNDPHVGATPSAVLLRNATPSVFHQRHIGRVLRSSCNGRGRRLASSRDREPRPGRCPPRWPGDLRNDGGSWAAAGGDGSEA